VITELGQVGTQFDGFAQPDCMAGEILQLHYERRDECRGAAVNFPRVHGRDFPKLGVQHVPDMDDPRSIDRCGLDWKNVEMLPEDVCDQR